MMDAIQSGGNLARDGAAEPQRCGGKETHAGDADRTSALSDTCNDPRRARHRLAASVAARPHAITSKGTAGTMAPVEIRDVRKAFGSTHVIHGVTIDIQDGEFVILVGPSGCGKSTLLRMIAGLENITGGEIRIGSKVVNNVPPKERDIAMVFQNYALYPHMTVADNMAFSLKLRGAQKSEIESLVSRAS
jgi:ABC-type glutathione transport system ATPase component